MPSSNSLLRATTTASKQLRLPALNSARFSSSRPIAAMDSITLPAPFDAHVHLRQGNMMRLVTPHVEQGGIRMAFVMVRHRCLPSSLFRSSRAECG